MSLEEMLIHLKQKRLLLELRSVRTSLDVQKLYLQFLMNAVKLGETHPCFEDDLFDYLYGNCYTYALGLKSFNEFLSQYIKLSRGELFAFNCGFMSTIHPFVHNEEELLNYFCQDCALLGIQVFETEQKYPNIHGGYKIKLYVSHYQGHFAGFHFIRQNADGTWSDKFGYFHLPRKLKYPMAPDDSYEYFKTFEIVKSMIRKRKR